MTVFMFPFLVLLLAAVWETRGMYVRRAGFGLGVGCGLGCGLGDLGLGFGSGCESCLLKSNSDLDLTQIKVLSWA